MLPVTISMFSVLVSFSVSSPSSGEFSIGGSTVNPLMSAKQKKSFTTNEKREKLQSTNLKKIIRYLTVKDIDHVP